MRQEKKPASAGLMVAGADQAFGRAGHLLENVQRYFEPTPAVDGHINCHDYPRENGGSTWNMGVINVACGTEFVSYCGFLALLNVVSQPSH